MLLFNLFWNSENAPCFITCSLGFQEGVQQLGLSLALTMLSKNTKSYGVTTEAQLQLRVKIYLGNKLIEGFKD